MKAKKIISVLFFLLSAGIVTAQNGPQARPEPVITPSFSMVVAVNTSATRFDLQVQNPDRKRLHVQISSNMGPVVDTVITSTSFNQRYNMEQVEDGQYTITVSNGKEKQMKMIELKTIVTRGLEVIK